MASCVTANSRRLFLSKQYRCLPLQSSFSLYNKCAFQQVRSITNSCKCAQDNVQNTNDERPETFIDKAKRLGANALLGYLTHSGERFDRTMQGLKVVKLGDGYAICEMTVNKSLINTYGTLHGGAICTLIDVVGTVALLTKDATRAGVSVELNLSFLSAAKEGEEIIVEGKVLKTGRKLGFTEVVVKRKSDGTILASGRHTKAL